MDSLFGDYVIFLVFFSPFYSYWVHVSVHKEESVVEVSTREDCSDMVSSQKKIFISWPATTLGVLDAIVAPESFSGRDFKHRNHIQG